MNNMLSNLSKREKRILALSACLIAASFFYSCVLEPVAKKWVELDREIQVKSLRLKKSSEILRRRIEIMEEYKSIAPFVQPKTGSDEEEMALFLSELEKLASSSGARITNIKPKAAKVISYYTQYTVEIESEGPISAISKFIYGIQNSRQILTIKKLSLSKRRTSDDTLSTVMVVTKILP